MGFYGVFSTDLMGFLCNLGEFSFGALLKVLVGFFSSGS